MSQRHAIQDATGVLSTDDVGDILIVSQSVIPTDASDSGYAVGCLWLVSDADAAKNVYVKTNTGSSVWAALH
jgi:hypothetical protein